MIVRALLVALAAGLAGWIRWLLRRPKRVAHALIVSPPDHTTVDESTGAVRSVQSADLIIPADSLQEIWAPRDLERLARTYWRFLTRATAGIVQIDYQEDGRQVKAFGLIPLLTFRAPEYEMDVDRGIVRWRIQRGILVSRRGRGGDGYLEIDVQRRPSQDYPGASIVHVEIEVANFYPAIASGLGRWLYDNTQSRIHALMTHGFLRSLARLDLAESRAKRFANIEDVPDPPPPGERRRTPARATPER